MPGSRIEDVNDPTQRLWTEQPDEAHEVVVVLTPESEDVSPEVLGLDGFEAIPYQPGMFKGSMTGADLLRLAERPEVEDISPDDEVTAL